VVSDVRKRVQHKNRLVSSALPTKDQQPSPTNCKDCQPMQVQTSVYAAHLMLYPIINRYSPTCPLDIPRFPAPISGNLYSKRVPRQEPRRTPFISVKIRLADDSTLCVVGLPPLPGLITCLGDVTHSSDTYASELGST
jgi:hypothetical protein